VRDLEKERSFDKESAIQKALLLGEEMGELFKAIRKYDSTLGIDAKSKVGTIEEELADILIYVCAIANKYGIDLEKSFLEKESQNKTRTWKRSSSTVLLPRAER